MGCGRVLGTVAVMFVRVVEGLEDAVSVLGSCLQVWLVKGFSGRTVGFWEWSYTLLNT